MSLISIIAQFINTGSSSGGGGGNQKTYNIMVEGDSISAFTPTWLSMLETNLNNAVKYKYFQNFAESGNSINGAMNLPGQIAQVVAGKKFDVDRNVLFLFAGINDIQTDNTGANTYGLLINLIAQYAPYSFKIVVFTLTASRAVIFNEAKHLVMWQAVQDFNALLLANWQSDGIDVVINLQTDPSFAGYNAPMVSDHFIPYPDNLHHSLIGRTKDALFAAKTLEWIENNQTGIITFIDL